MEKVINWQMKGYLESYNLLPTQQHAYRVGRSTSGAWSDVDLFVSKARDEGRHVSMTCEDMSSAFNTVDVSVITPKLRMMGFGDKSLELITNYMKGRRNCTRVDNHVTDPRHVHTGIGEGSVLGPLVFLITVINVEVVLERTRARVMSMFPTLKSAPYSPQAARTPTSDWNTSMDLRMWIAGFADDISGLVDTCCPNVMRATMTILSEEFMDFFSAQGLKVNGEKEEHITWAKSAGHRAEVTLGGRDSTPQLKLLGLTVDNTYSFMPHAVSVTRKMMTRVSYLYRIRDNVSEKVLRIITTSLIFSLYQYCLEITGRAPAVQRYLQKTLNVVLRVATWGKRDTAVAGMLAELKALNIPNQHKLSCVMSMYRLLDTKCSQLESDLIRVGNAHKYTTRNNALYCHWQPTTARGDYSHLKVSLSIYNQLGIHKHNFAGKEEFKEGTKNLIILSHGNGNV